MLGCGSRCTYRVELLEPNRVFGHGRGWLTKDKVILVIAIEIQINLLNGHLVLIHHIHHQVEVVHRVLEIVFIFSDGLFLSFDYFACHLGLQGIMYPSSNL